MSAFFLHHPKETDLALFAGGESGPLSRWRVERHIEGCSACKAIVADYFHLTEELQPLAELPDLNWDAMALGIERRLAAEETVEVRRPAVPALAWAASLAAVAVISGVVVMRQQPSALPAETAVMEMESAAQVGGFSDFDSTNQVDREAQAMSQETAPPVMEAKAKAAPESEPEQIARVEKREMPRVDRSAPVLADELAPAPPPPPLGLRAGAAPAASSVGGALGEADTRGRAPMRVARQAASKESASLAALDIQPLFEQGSDVRVAADGWISVRSISAEGRVTITDVYAP